MPTTAADLLVDRLIGWGVDTIFGLPGDGVNGVMEALRKRQGEIRFVGVRHESSAAFAATAYAKFSGRLGVCLSTSGPGATNLLTGLYDAKMDGAPVLAITGLQFHDLLGTNYQQDIDTPALFKDVAVYSERIMGPAHIDSIADVAVRYALAKRGVAHLGFPTDLQHRPVDADEYGHMDRPRHTSHDLRKPRVIPTESDLLEAAGVLNAGSRVAIVAGQGCRGAVEELTGIADLLGATITTPYLGKDIVPSDNPYLTGTMGVWETPATAKAFKECDTVLIVGSSFPYISYLPEPEGKRAVQIDLAGERLGLRHPVDVALVGDARETLQLLTPLVTRKEDRDFLEGVHEEVRRWKRIQDQEQTEGPIKGATLAQAVNRVLAEDAIVCGDSGQNTSYMAKGIEANGKRRISGSGTLASMASALPYAIGAATAFPERQVVAFVGDGGLAMLMGDLATLARYGLNVKVVVASNSALNMIRWEQMMNEGNPEYGIELSPIDFSKVAEGCGLRGAHVRELSALGRTLEEIFSSSGPALIQVDVDPLDPMVPGEMKPEVAEHYAQALASGQPYRETIEANLRTEADKAGGENRAVVDKALSRKAELR